MRLLIVDLSSVFYPQWHAGADKPIGFAFEGAVARVRRAAQGFDRVCVACDSGRSFRHDIDKAYKAHRERPDPLLLEQLRRVQDTLRADGFCVISAEGFEADDVVATVATWARPVNRATMPGQVFDPPPFAEVELLSSDKDLAILTEIPGVTIRSVSTNDVMGPVEVCAKFKLKRPEQVRDFLALCGDTSDGVRGVKGVGAVRASGLLGDFGSINGIVEALDAMPESAVREALRSAWKDGTLQTARQLVTLRTDVPLDFAAVLEKREPQALRPDFGADMPEETSGEPAASPGGEGGTATTPARGPEEAGTSSETRDVPQRDGTVVQEVNVIREAKPEPTAESILGQVTIPVEWSQQLEPKTMKDAAWLSKQLNESRLLTGSKAGEGYGSPEQIMAVILAGRELGLGAMTSLRGINIIKNRIAMSAQLMMGLCLARRAEFFEMVESDEYHALYETKRIGGRSIIPMTFTIELARSYNLLRDGSVWAKDPAAMLRWRCAAALARVAYPDVVSGCYLPDELED